MAPQRIGGELLALRCGGDTNATVLEPVLLEPARLFALCVGVAATFPRLRLPPNFGFPAAGGLEVPLGQLAPPVRSAPVGAAEDPGP